MSRLSCVGDVRRAANVIDDPTEGFELCHILGCDGRQAGNPLFEGGEDFHALDGVDAEVGFISTGYPVSMLTTPNSACVSA